MEERQRRSFTEDYKRQAVDLVASSGRSIGSVAKELGLRDSVLRRWVELRGAGGSRGRDRPFAARERAAAHGARHFKKVDRDLLARASSSAVLPQLFGPWILVPKVCFRAALTRFSEAGRGWRRTAHILGGS